MKNITKEQFVAVLDAAEITDAQKQRLHAEFEQRYPESHEAFLAFLGIASADIAEIRRRSRQH